MTTLKTKHVSWLFAGALLMGACGGSGSDSGLDSEAADTTTTVPVEESTTTEATVEETTTTTVEETTTTVEETTTTAAAESGGNIFSDLTPEESAELAEAMGMTEADLALLGTLLETDAGRQLFAEGMTEGSDLTQEQALCLVDEADIVALMMVGADAADVDGPLMADLLEDLETCGIPLEAFTG